MTNEQLQALLATKINTRRGFTDKDRAPIAVCADGFEISIQASHLHYCIPREDVGPYTTVELGFPNQEDALILEYADQPSTPTDSVYAYVPVKASAQQAQQHLPDLCRCSRYLKRLAKHYGP